MACTFHTLIKDITCDCCGEMSSLHIKIESPQIDVALFEAIPDGWCDTRELGLICPECMEMLIAEQAAI